MGLTTAPSFHSVVFNTLAACDEGEIELLAILDLLRIFWTERLWNRWRSASVGYFK
jgi:hypothetical protein